jgi:hypothetical protein
MLNVPTTTQTDWNQIADAPGLDESRFAADDRLYVTFSRKPKLVVHASREAGRAIYKEVDFIRIMVPGDKLTVVEREIDEIDRRRFASRYEKWLAGAGNVIEGTPLVSLPKMTPAKVEEYKFFNVHTVEQLAAAPDSLGQKFMGFNGDKQAAQAFIELAKGNAPIEKMHEELKTRDAKIEEMQAQIDALIEHSKSKKVATKD